MQSLKKLFIKIESEMALLTFDETTIQIPIGFDTIKNRFLKNSPPSEIEIEYAINYIEDEIEKIVKKLPKTFQAFCNDEFIEEIVNLLKLKQENETIIYTSEFENLFGLYAQVSMGNPAMYFQTDLSSLFYAKLLILRELTHHLRVSNFKYKN